MLFNLASSKKLILMEAIKTAYSTAFARMLLLVKSGKIGDVLSVDSVCTSLKTCEKANSVEWNGIFEWGPTALLPIFQILGTDYKDYRIISQFRDKECRQDAFTKMEFIYEHAVASIKVGDGVKSEGELIISGTKGYIYVPAPWWKTDYFELRYEDQNDNKKFFYKWDAAGLRYEIQEFMSCIYNNRLISFSR